MCCWCRLLTTADACRLVVAGVCNHAEAFDDTCSELEIERFDSLLTAALTATTAIVNQDQLVTPEGLGILLVYP